MLRLENVRILHVRKAANREATANLSAGTHTVDVKKADGRIARISSPINRDDDPPHPHGGQVERIDCAGRVLMPGLIDSHVHVTASSANLRMPASMPASLVYCRAVPILEGMLSRGFTTVRDCGGADHGLAAAVAEGTLKGPNVIFCGKALSQTGGHGDFRAAGENALASGPCRCCNYTIGRVCDGVTACREAVRDEVRKGARHIKIMASGGVASPTDRLENLQFSEDELRAIVEEADNAGVYCAAHAYTDVAVREGGRAEGVICLPIPELGNIFLSVDDSRVVRVKIHRLPTRLPLFSSTVYRRCRRQSVPPKRSHEILFTWREEHEGAEANDPETTLK